MIIAIDFDGTCVTHEFPKVGKDIGAVPYLKQLVKNGHSLILWTMRSNKEKVESEDYNIHSVAGEYLNEAVNWFIDNDIELWGIQSNPNQASWTESPKAYAQIYIDDAALGCPLKYDATISERPFVNWDEVGKILGLGIN
jgi:hypothetical protein